MQSSLGFWINLIDLMTNFFLPTCHNLIRPWLDFGFVGHRDWYIVVLTKSSTESIQQISDETGIDTRDHTSGLDEQAQTIVTNSHKLCTTLIFPQS